jgi:hypothetical protein
MRSAFRWIDLSIVLALYNGSLSSKPLAFGQLRNKVAQFYGSGRSNGKIRIHRFIVRMLFNLHVRKADSF